jgi:5-methylcytosine-specific restriction endonuclease McrA
MSRSCPEWIAKHDDQAIPPRVKLRILERENFICHLTGAKIDPVRDKFDFEHKVSLILGGQHRESNIFPALRDPHKKKTAAEMKVKAKIAAVRKKHLGITAPKQTIRSAGFAKVEKPRRGVDKSSLPALPRKQLYREELS